MLNRLCKFLFVGIFATIALTLPAEERFVIIAEASIPELNASAKKLCSFSDEVSPGSSLILTGGVIALTFSVKDVSLTSDLRILLYGDTKGDNPAPQIAFIAKPIRDEIPDRVKFNKYKFPCKAIGDRLFIAETDELLQDVKTLPPKDTSTAALSVKLYPRKYFKDCSGTIEAFKAKLEKEFSKGRKDKNVEVKGEIKALEKVLAQLSRIELELDAGKDNLALDLTISPEENSEISKILNSNQGQVSDKKLIELTEKIAGSQDFIITDEIKSSLSYLLSQIFEESDTDAIADKLCKFNILSEGNKLNIGISITPKQARNILLSTGVLNKIEKKDGRKRIKF